MGACRQRGVFLCLCVGARHWRGRKAASLRIAATLSSASIDSMRGIGPVAARNDYRERDRIQVTKAHPQSTTNANKSRRSEETTICLYQTITKLSWRTSA